MDIGQFDKYVLVPALNIIGLYTPSAHVLMLGTGIIETNYHYIKQFNDGPGNGIYEIEEATYNDIYRYLCRHENMRLKETCMSSCLYSAWPDKESLIYNLRWCTIICRIKYHMIPDKIPSSFDAEGMAEYYKKYYNTEKGEANLEKAVDTFKHVITLMTKLS